jgi:hypothetical protein
MLEGVEGDGTAAEVNDDVQTLVNEYIKGADGPMASENIVSALRELTEKQRVTDIGRIVSLGGVPMRIVADIAASTKRVLQGIITQGAEGYGYLKQKFPGLTLEEVQSVLDLFRAEGDRFDRVKIRRLSGCRSCFLLMQD